MPYPQRLVLLTSITLTLLLAMLVTLTRTALAARAGEIAFESNRDDNWEIYLLDIQTGITRNLTHNPADDLSPAWSPDGSQLAFVSDRDGDTQPELYVVDANGGHLRRLSKSIGIYSYPSWLADGHSLVLNHGWKQIYRIDLDGQAERWLGSGFAPRVSPDGQWMIYYIDSSSGVNSNIYMLNLAKNLVTPLTTGPTHDWDADWSPDGQEIVFVSLRGGKTGIYVMDKLGQQVRPVTSGGHDLSPAWSPDGRQIVYSSGVEGDMHLFIVDADGGSPRPLTTIDGDSHAPVWRPEPG